MSRAVGVRVAVCVFEGVREGRFGVRRRVKGRVRVGVIVLLVGFC